MPGIVAHMTAAKLISTKLGIKDPDFIRGNLLPDILPGSKEITHYRIEGKWYHIPDTNKYKEEHDLNNNLNLGYYTHLLLDKYFMEEFIPNIVKVKDVFKTGLMYTDYDNSNDKLIKKYKLNVQELLSILKFPDIEVDEERYKKNIECLNIKGDTNTKLFKINEFEKFIEETSDIICDIIKSTN